MLKSKIEWCDSTWSPVTGCYHGCPYCYARSTATRFKGCDIAQDGYTDLNIVVLKERLKYTDKDGVVRNAAYPYGFKPTLHEYRLKDLETKKFRKNVFICSMADLFGDWIPDEWILKVFEACKAAPRFHRYLFLTKNPERYKKLQVAGLLPDEPNFWYGTTVEKNTDKAFVSENHRTFISMEPMLTPMNPSDLMHKVNTVQWVIIGAETGNRVNKVVPERSWIEPVVEACKWRGISVFMKDTLKPIWGDDIITEFPWND